MLGDVCFERKKSFKMCDLVKDLIFKNTKNQYKMECFYG